MKTSTKYFGLVVGP